MARPRRLPALLALSALALALGCAGPPISAPIEGILVCPDFASGNAKMEGGLRFPVRLRVLDGKNVLYRTIIGGLRSADAAKPQSYIADDNARYTVEWAQCSNPRAPHSVAELSLSSKVREKAQAHEGEGTAYDCGEATLYKPDGVLETKKGNRASHVLTFVPPPNLECWTGETTPPAGAAPSTDAGAVPAAGGDAGALGDAGSSEAASADAGAAGDAGASPSAAVSPVDAGAASAGDAGAAKAKP
jgi:hypothetical protein